MPLTFARIHPENGHESKSTPMSSPRSLLVLAALLGGFSPVFAATSAVIDPPDVSPAQPSIPDHAFNVRDFGGKGDSGVTVNTTAFQQAIAAVRQAGGGTLVVPAGTYFTGPFDLCSRINLHLEAGATILFSPRFDDYSGGQGGRKYRPLIAINDAHDVLVSGAGTIDGNGMAWWPEAYRFKAVAKAEHAAGDTSPRPTMLAFSRCQRIRVEGITMTDAPVFNLVQNACSDVTVEGVTITNPGHSPNTDGIDPKACQRVLIAHCRIDTGDDCVALGGGAGVQEEKDVLVTDCTFLQGHGCSIGSGTGCGVSNVVVRRCTFDGTDTGVRLKSSRGRGGLTQNIIYEDLTMRHVGVAISISSYYDNTPIDAVAARAAAQPMTRSTPQWRAVTVRNVTATACRVRAGMIVGLPEAPAEAITLDHVSIEAPLGLRLADARGVTLRAVTITAAQGPDVIAADSVQGLARE